MQVASITVFRRLKQRIAIITSRAAKKSSRRSSMYFFLGLALLISIGKAAAQSLQQGSSKFDTGWEFTSIEFNQDKADQAVKKRGLGKNWEDQFTVQKVDQDSAGALQAHPDLQQQLALVKNQLWRKVVLPHTAFVEPVAVLNPREGLAYYRKSFTLPRSVQGKKVTIEFEGAMQIANVWFNGQFITRHLGGYLPFTIDITKVIRYDRKNELVVQLDNRASPLVPPGKPVSKLDFIYYSGLYRDVWLHISDQLHITNAGAVNKVAGGGIFVTYKDVSKASATVNIATDIQNDYEVPVSFKLSQQLLDRKGAVVAQSSTGRVALAASSSEAVQQTLEVVNPELWHPDHPYLYQLVTKVQREEKGGLKDVDELKTRIGIRSLTISRDRGLLINGEPFRVEGSNRHMNYPWIGNALSDNANYRDAIIIKKAGINCLRLAHYPQDPSFYDACDSLGILLVDCIPGWQFLNKAKTFTDLVMEDIRQMIRRDRNHPSIVLWEVSLNETYPPATFRNEQQAVATSEWPADAGFYTSGDSYFVKAGWDVPYDDWNGDPGARNNTTYPGNAFLIREYGDYEFGGGESTSRKSRGTGEKGMLQQAWNLQWEHNKNRKSYPASIGDLTWAFYDGLAGVTNIVETWGMADLYRIPKFSYYFFESQKKMAAPMVYIADYWEPRPANSERKVIVYSNCDEVRLYVNDKLVATRKPDSGPETSYGTELDKGGHPFDGGNANHLSSPPFTFQNIVYQKGKLKAVGYRNGDAVCHYEVVTPGKPVRLALTADTQGIALAADGADAVFVRATLMDADNNPVYTTDTAGLGKVHFNLKGDGSIVSPKVIEPEAGIASVLIRSGVRHGKLRITATLNGLKPAVLILSK